jgi:hypothetical protein
MFKSCFVFNLEVKEAYVAAALNVADQNKAACPIGLTLRPLRVGNIPPLLTKLSDNIMVLCPALAAWIHAKAIFIQKGDNLFSGNI